ncbi:hypothetical protein UAY_01073 [Enterococcus moraviensis ATCC BAA-383]|uniref:Phage envelope protein n=1 Tax=Enterococcus moraviensis ATCC BAA-383 TaxID=1158609 RepID=R2QYJ2_9ENTE|nr:hypothetical protein UAY_01073 [Enterococcus moraviensis ATCC BAA-383]EOT73800.1 hypothetical protein I586_00794 [Enterococcus moraviensis ATCC BAA-383]OJG65120.1 hypothetical protein RV09_GL001281 [Enterococcus moraviensis]
MGVKNLGLDLNAIEAVVNNEKNAGGFAELIREFKKIGVEKYDYLVEAGIYRYYNKESFIDVQMNGRPKPVAESPSSTEMKKAVVQAQAGEISFEEFAELAGASGVAYWRTDLLAMRVDYSDQDGKILLSEPIPEV